MNPQFQRGFGCWPDLYHLPQIQHDYASWFFQWKLMAFHPTNVNFQICNEYVLECQLGMSSGCLTSTLNLWNCLVEKN